MAQLLTLSRLEPHEFHAARKRCDLRAVLRRAISDLAPAAFEKGIELELEEAPAGNILGDAPLLDILFRNLIDNAVRYSPPRSHVRIHVEQNGGDVSVIVADEGPGIPFEEREHLGRRFHRLAGTEVTGTGLGLSIARRIAELHGGRIAFDETTGGVGLAVNVRFRAAT